MDVLSLVNIKQGTRSDRRHSHGNTLPLVQMPFGMHGIVLQTDAARGNWFYHPDDGSVEMIRVTHQASPWVGDYCSFGFLPAQGPFYLEEDIRASSFDKKGATLRPDFLHVFLQRYRASVDLVPTLRGGVARICFEESPASREGANWDFRLFTVSGYTQLQIDSEQRMVYGIISDDRVPMLRLYLVMQFDTEINPDKCMTILPGQKPVQALECEGEKAAVSVSLSKKSFEMRFAVSYISIEQARYTLERECLSWETARQAARTAWEECLDRIRITTANEDLRRTFYSCLYRQFLYPHTFHEISPDGTVVHRCPDTGKIRKGKRFVDCGFWDTCRTTFPLFSIIAPDIYRQLMEGIVNTYVSTGYLPQWPGPNEKGYMTGSMVDVVIAQAAVSKITDKELLNKALEGMCRHARNAGKPPYGRKWGKEYQEYGYVPCDMASQSVSQTIDYSYGDFCIASTAAELGRDEIAAEFWPRSQSYRNLFDPETGFMRAKDRKGNFLPKFHPFDWSKDYCEGSAWQALFLVQHDLDGIIQLHGGRESLLRYLDALFDAPAWYNVCDNGPYDYQKSEMHEMSELASLGLGQCAINNQPGFHVPFLYAMLGQPDRTTEIVRKITETQFSWHDDGFPGDEDNGSMAAWYLFAVLGLYPFCPGTDRLLNFPPLVEEADIYTGEGFVKRTCFKQMHTITYSEIKGEKRTDKEQL